MKIVCWNCRGVGNDNFRRSTQDLIRMHHPSAISFVEIKYSSNSTAPLRFMNNLGFNRNYQVPVTGRKAFITFAYVQPRIRLKQMFWRDLEFLSQQTSDAWVLMRDLNGIEHCTEAFPPADRDNLLVEGLASANLFTMEAVGAKYTWVQRRSGIVRLRKRLDRAAMNLVFPELFPAGKLFHLDKLHSDHHPLLLSTSDIPLPMPYENPKRFLAA